jgi:hypothetical protein
VRLKAFAFSPVGIVVANISTNPDGSGETPVTSRMISFMIDAAKSHGAILGLLTVIMKALALIGVNVAAFLSE